MSLPCSVRLEKASPSSHETADTGLSVKKRAGRLSIERQTPICEMQAAN